MTLANILAHFHWCSQAAARRTAQPCRCGRASGRKQVGSMTLPNQAPIATLLRPHSASPALSGCSHATGDGDAIMQSVALWRLSEIAKFAMAATNAGALPNVRRMSNFERQCLDAAATRRPMHVAVIPRLDC